MEIVKFNHKEYGEMSTTTHHWIESIVFDATDKNGDCKVVNKEDCEFIKIEEL